MDYIHCSALDTTICTHHHRSCYDFSRTDKSVGVTTSSFFHVRDQSLVCQLVIFLPHISASFAVGLAIYYALYFTVKCFFTKNNKAHIDNW